MTQDEAHKIAEIILKRYASIGFEPWQISTESIIQDAIEIWESRAKCTAKKPTQKPCCAKYEQEH